MHVCEILERELAQIRSAFMKLRQAPSQDPERRRELFTLASARIRGHIQLQENHFLPALRRFDGASGHLEEARRQQKSIDDLLSKLSSLEAGHVRFRSVAEELGRAVGDYLDWETNTFFPAVRNALPREDAEKLGRLVLKEREAKNRGMAVAPPR